MRMRRALVSAPMLCALGPQGALAHAFSSGRDGYEQFIEGASVTLAAPALILPLAALGIFVGLWRADGMVRVWPLFLAAQVVGVGLAVLVGPWIATAGLAFGIATAVIAALRGAAARPVVFAMVALGGVIALAGSLEGHGFAELPVMIHLGILAGANVAVSAVAGLVVATTRRWRASWIAIGWRIAASWLAAIMVLFLAFMLRS